MNASTAKTMPLKMPLYVPAAACVGLNVCSVRRPVFDRIIHAESATKTEISKMPRITPACVDSRMSRYVRKKTIPAEIRIQIHHCPV